MILFPNLRFPGFEGEWEENTIGDLGELFGGGTPDSNNTEYWEGSIPWISSSDISEGAIHLINKTRFITEEAINHSATRKVPKGSVLIVSRVGIGKFAVADCELCTSQDFTNLVSTQNEYFLAYYFVARAKRFVRLSQGTSIKGFTSKDIKLAKFLIPQCLEQSRIASFLTIIDRRIQAQSKTIEQLETLMKGLTQKIFNQEIRFKNDDGSAFPDWEDRRLGEIGSFQTSSIDKLSRKDESEVFLVNYMNVYRHENINNESTLSFQIVTAKQSQMESCNLREGDILFTPSSETPTDIGHSVVVFEDLKNTVFSYHLIRFRPKLKLNILYSHYFCNTPSVARQLSQYATGSTRFTISVKSFSNIKVFIPCLLEQAKIASFLSLINQKIEIERQILDQYNQQKKYLLQNLFI